MINRPAIILRIGFVFIWVGLIVGLSLALLRAPAQAAEPAAPSSGLRVIHSDQDRLVLELAIPEYVLRQATTTADQFQQIVVDGASALDVPGQPELPKFSALLGIPPQGRVSVQVLQDSTQEIAGQHRLLPAAAPAPSAGDLQPGVLQHIPDRAAYASAELYPAEVARVVETAWLRDQRLARLELYPFQYQASTGTLIWHRSLRIEVRFEEGRTSDRTVAPAQNNPFEQILEHEVLNYDVARSWRSNAAAPPAASRSTAATPRYRIVVDHDGLYRVTYDDLLAAGLVLTSFDPRNLHVTNQGLDVAVEVVGESDGQFDSNDAVLFYGQRLRGDLLASKHPDEAANWLTLNGWRPEFNAKMVEKYTDDNVYWLEVGTTPGLRMTTVDGTPAGAPVAEYYTTTAHAEKSIEWRTTHFSSEDTWYWEEIPVVYTTMTKAYTVELSAIAAAPVSAVVRAELAPRAYGAPSNPTTHITYRLNTPNNLLADILWTSSTRLRLETASPLTGLLEGRNTLTLTVSASNIKLYFDWFEIQYPRRFVAEGNQLTFTDNGSGARQYAIGNFTTPTLQMLNVSNPWQPQRVMSSSTTSEAGLYTATFQVAANTPVTYYVGGADQIQTPKQISRYVPADLSGGNGADYLIITHHDFITAMQTLAAHREAEGLRVKIVDVNDLYNQFTDGIYHPIAIKDFLKYVYANWQPPAPTYVLLVGDGHWNFKNFNPAKYGAPPNFMPPNLQWVDPYQGEVDSANDLVTLVGTDPIPDMLVGRLPVNTAAEAGIVVNKIINYEAQAKTLPYRQHMLFVADIPDPNAGDFVQFSNDLIRDILPSTFVADRAYANSYTCPPGVTSCSLNYVITATLNQTGALFVNYIGHGAINLWGANLFANANVSTLNNLDRLPIILSMTCLDGYWIYPSADGSYNSLMETMLRAANGGSVASFSPTGLGVSTGHDQMERGLLEAVFNSSASRLGTAALASKVALFNYGQDYDLIHTFTVFGDPALHLPTYALDVSPSDSVRFGTPNKVVTHTIQLTNTGFLTNTALLSILGNAWPMTAPQTSLELPPGQAQSLLISVTVPATVALGALDVATVTLRSSSDDYQTIVHLATINGLYGAVMAVDPMSQQADPGTVVTYTAQITNLGVLTDSFSLNSVENAWPTQLSASSLDELPPNGSATFTVTVSVPGDKVAYSADVAHLVIASQGSLGFVNTITPLTTTINPVYGFEMDSLPQQRVGVSGQTVIYPVTITNTGNATNTFTTAVSEALWPTVVSSTVGPLAPWSNITVPVRVSVPLGQSQGAVDTATVAITMSLGGPASNVISMTTIANPYQIVLPLVLKLN